MIRLWNNWCHPPIIFYKACLWLAIFYTVDNLMNQEGLWFFCEIGWRKRCFVYVCCKNAALAVMHTNKLVEWWISLIVTSSTKKNIVAWKKERKILEKYSKLFFNHYKIQIPSSALSRSHLDLFKGYGRDVKEYICHDLNAQQLYKAYYLILYR